jgi:hypothetical protein
MTGYQVRQGLRVLSCEGKLTQDELDVVIAALRLLEEQAESAPLEQDE